MTNDEYTALPGIRASELKHGRKSMGHMRAAVLGELPKSTPALRFGRLFHGAVLEPDIFANKAVVWRGGRRGTKAYEAFLMENGGDEEWVLDQDEFSALLRMGTSVHANTEAHRLIEGTTHEVTLSWTDKLYGAAKCRMDGYHDGIGLLEVKSAADVGARRADGRYDGTRFFSAFARMGYDLQLGWYAEGLAAHGMPVSNVSLIAVEKSSPYSVVVLDVPGHIVESGRKEAVELARAYRCCEAAGHWPGVAEGRQVLELPEWASEKVDDSGIEEVQA